MVEEIAVKKNSAFGRLFLQLSILAVRILINAEHKLIKNNEVETNHIW
jgi:hypothetical protein